MRASVRRSIGVRRFLAPERGGKPAATALLRLANFPIASDARLAGDGKQTRFILDLDKAVTFRAFTLADPYRVVVDIPQVNFQLPAGTGARGGDWSRPSAMGWSCPAARESCST